MSGGEPEEPQAYTATVNGKQHRITVDEVERFASLYFRDSELCSRVSRLLVVDLWVYMVAFDQNPAQITREIEALEGKINRPRGTKPATRFNKPPLVGLWHKHWFSSLFMARNIQTGWAGGRIRRLVQDAASIYNQGLSTDDEANAALADRVSRDFARQAVEETLELRRGASALTGQWIVFAKHDEKNYYLCLNTHKSGDQVIFNRIRDHCFDEFPFLRSLHEP